MKKILCMALAILMLCGAVIAMAEGAFDLSKVTSSELYHYNKFDKTWDFQGSYIKEYSDAAVRIGIVMFNDCVDYGVGPEMRVMVFNKNTQQYYEVTAFRAIVGDKVFRFELLQPYGSSSSLMGGSVLRKFCDALIDGGDVAFQIDYKDSYGTIRSITIDPVDRKDLAELIEMAKLMRDSNAWSCDINPEYWDSVFGAIAE